MKLVSKIAVLAGLIAFVSSCQKENLPLPAGGPSHSGNTAIQRGSDQSETTGDSGRPVIQGEGNSGTGEIVGGGDDDRDGGGKRLFNPVNGRDSIPPVIQDESGSETGDGDIVGGGDDDRDGGGERKVKKGG